MQIVYFFFEILSMVISVYSFLCLANIFLSWIPAARYTKFGQFICAVTDPYLNLFRRIRWLQVGNLNFSPILSIGLLSILSSLLSTIAGKGKFIFSLLLIELVRLLWNIIFGIGIIFFLLALVRLIVLTANRGATPYNSAWNHVDALLSSFCYKITKPFSTILKKPFSYRTALAITTILLAVGLTASYILTILLISLCKMIPF